MKQGMRIVVFGANSTICHEVMKLYAGEGATFFLVARNEDRLSAVAQDLVARGGVLAGTASYDFKEWERHEPCITAAREALGGFDLGFVAHGTQPDQAECEVSTVAVRACMDDNFTSVAVIAQSLAAVFATQGSGTLAVISSVAGDRGRKSNYCYGAAKAGLDALLQGLQGRFAASPVRVVNIKPGMTITPLTADMKHGLFWSTAAAIAPGIRRAVDRGLQVHYAPGYWRLIMLLIRSLPTAVLARLPI